MRYLIAAMFLGNVVACKGDEVVVDNSAPNCPDGYVYMDDVSACMPEDAVGDINVGDEFDLLLTISDCATETGMDVDVVTFLAVKDGYEQDIEKLLNQPEGVYMINNLIMGDKYYIEITKEGYVSLKGEFQVTQQTDTICLDSSEEFDLFAAFNDCLEAGNTMGLCCLNYPDPLLDATCNR